jgi:hypothetical protein
MASRSTERCDHDSLQQSALGRSMNEFRQLATVRSYTDLVAAIRGRIIDLKTTYDSVDALAGLADRHTSKLICWLKHYGPISLGATLGALGLMLIVVVDTEQFERIRGRLAARHQGRRTVHGPTGAP